MNTSHELYHRKKLEFKSWNLIIELSNNQKTRPFMYELVQENQTAI